MHLSAVKSFAEIMEETKFIAITPYDFHWPKQFEIEAQTIQTALGKNLIAIHHIGSTSVPGLAAKPKIDIIAVVRNLNFPQSPLNAAGYIFRGSFNIPLQRYATLRSADRAINLHIFEENDPEIELNLLFRNHLRQFPDCRNAYETLKYSLVAEQSSPSPKKESIYSDYTLGKNEFIQNVLKNAGFNGQRFLLCTHYSEWNVIRHFRRCYFANLYHCEDPFTATFHSPEHRHFIFCRGTEIIGYAHIQLLPDQKATLPMIFICKTGNNNSCGRQFLNLCRKWLENERYDGDCI